jgi:hypothetical protein
MISLIANTMQQHLCKQYLQLQYIFSNVYILLNLLTFLSDVSGTVNVYSP